MRTHHVRQRSSQHTKHTETRLFWIWRLCSVCFVLLISWSRLCSLSRYHLTLISKDSPAGLVAEGPDVNDSKKPLGWNHSSVVWA